MGIHSKNLDARFSAGTLLQRAGVKAWQGGHFWRARWLFWRSARKDKHCALSTGRFLQEVANTTTSPDMVWQAHRQAARAFRRMLPELASHQVYTTLAGEYDVLRQLTCDPKKQCTYGARVRAYTQLAACERRCEADRFLPPPLPHNVTGALDMPARRPG